MLAQDPVDPGRIREELARILENRRFSSAGRLRAFLQFAVEKTLAGEAEQIKEYAIALEVYGRSEDYDPKVDSIVRVEATRLRSRLSEYYQSDGREDAVVIELPKGSYVPVFRVHAPEPARSIPAAPPVAPLSAPTTKRWLLPIGAGLVAAAIAIGFGNFQFWRTAGPGPGNPSIALAPFTNLSLDPANNGLVRGLGKDIEAAFTRSGKLRVLGVGGADYTLEASVRRQDNRVRVIAQLLDRRDGAYIWSDSFERESEDSMQTQSDMARRIAGDVETQALAAARQRSEGSSPRGRALALYREGRAQMHLKEDGFLLRGSESYEKAPLEVVNRAISLLEQSVAADPTFAAGFATLATFYQVAGEYDVRLMDKAVAAAKKAIELDPHLGEAHATLGYINYMYYWKFPEAAEEFRIALEHEPRLLSTYRLYADCLALLGRPDEGQREIERARVVYPNHPVIETKLVMEQYVRGRYKEMESDARGLVQRFPTYHLSHWALGLALEALGRYDEAIQELRECLKTSPGDGRCTPALGHAYAVAGRRAEAEEIIARIRNRPATQTRAPYEVAMILNGLGQREAAVANLQSAFEQRELGFPYLKLEPRLANLRDHPAIVRILASIGL